MCFKAAIVFESLGSTQDEIKSGIDQKIYSHGSIVRALRQSAGRGRYARVWDDGGAGNLAVSIALKPDINLLQWGSFSLVTGLSLVEAIDLDGLILKWPNDILLGGQKVGGILCEVYQDYFIIGMGVNVAHAPDGAACLGGAFHAEDLLDQFVNVLKENYRYWNQYGFDQVLEKRWQDRAYPIGSNMSVKIADHHYHGIFKGLGDFGSLLLGLDDGRIKIITSGDIVMKDK